MPYWPPGTRIVWREGSGPLGTGPLVVDPSVPHFAAPVTVVQDDPAGLVVWLPIGTPVLRAARADGLGKREDPQSLFTAPLVASRDIHGQFDQLRIAPTGCPWSVWLFFSSGGFAGWYVNLERPHVRTDRAVLTSDRVLDVVVAPDRTVTLKDEDELELAVAQGVFTSSEAAAITADAASIPAPGRLPGLAVLRRLGELHARSRLAAPDSPRVISTIRTDERMIGTAPRRSPRPRCRRNPPSSAR
ncbi:DUF402 domain-containing protein [Nocardioides sp. B-3]|uniref:DUF402 domain-containing protein n=1 Tax=Nocardioides sp. B-3 TaxID=2895565 RepID=UPI00215311C6|nr:DUF402 domain-containing protein [Nocardioides sp. B-3]UUZ58115.1 DUF402 domain-containing protein [Nocardioides sp. B-3]